MKKPSIPSLAGVKDVALQRILSPIKENIETINGTRQGIVEKLPANTTDLPTIVAKLNELIDRINVHD